MKQSNEQQPNMQTRPPVVVIMGHIDHGKTSILDYIRKAKVAEGEAGGITQSIGAYQVEHGGKTITFIDTPGHEVFYAMRARGAKVADIAVLVVAADDGVMQQTKEAIDHIRHAGIPMIIAINKIDKQNADLAKVKNQLLESEIIVEDYQGKVPSVEVSAKTGQGVDELLETVNLMAELEELMQDTNVPARGVVIEAQMSDRRGPTATMLIREGVLKRDDCVALSSTYGAIRVMEDFMGKAIESASPGMPVLVVGLEEVPLVGDTFKAVQSLKEAKQIAAEEARKYKIEGEVLESMEGVKVLRVILKADVQGTLEAAREVLKGIRGENFTIRILSQSVGDITEADIKLSAAAGALIVGFRTKLNAGSLDFAKQMKVEVVTSEIIYELVEKVRAKINDFLSGEKKEVSVGRLKVLAIFRTEKGRMIVGGRVLEGEMHRGAKARVWRGEEIISEGRIAQVKVGDKAAEKPVAKGQECGVLFEGQAKIQAGDELETYEITQVNVQL